MLDEFLVLKKILKTLEPLNRNHPALIVPPGDDAALLAPLSRPVISTDTQREGIHFRLDWQTPFEIGYKSVVAALSDLAASFARPVCLFINLGLPAQCREILVEDLYLGVRGALADYACAMGGGNISASPVLSLDLFVLGEAEGRLFPRRSAAAEGDGVYVTGPLGLARAGLVCLQKGITTFPDLVHAFKKPRARFDAANVLLKHDVACVMDLSDGLAGDAGHLAEASDLTFRLGIDRMCIPHELSAFCTCHEEPPLHMMMSGGEDYELLFTCPPSVFETLQKELPQAFRVGCCIPYTGSRLEGVPESCRSFVHGKNTGNTPHETV